jgi:hypothetical protein
MEQPRQTRLASYGLRHASGFRAHLLEGRHLFSPVGNLAAEIAAKIDAIVSGDGWSSESMKQSELIKSSHREMRGIARAHKLARIEQDWERTQDSILNKWDFKDLTTLILIMISGSNGKLRTSFGLFWLLLWSLSMVALR